MEPVFLYDFNSPYAYLAAERVDEVLPDARWQPVAFAFLLIAQQREPWSFHEPERSMGMAEIERRAAERGLPPVVLPDGWPQGSYAIAPLRVALVAAEHGLLKEYSHAASPPNSVAATGVQGDASLGWAEEVGRDRAAVEAGLPAAKDRLKEATDAAI